MIMIKAFLIFFIFPLIGVLAICLGIWHERKKEVERRGRRWKYLIFSIIGILSLLAGFYLGDEMHLGYVIFKATGGLLTIFPFALIIYALLFSIGLYISREHSLGFGLKVFGISFLFLFLAFHGIMAYGAHEHYYAKAISVHKLNTPSEYANITKEELEEYPALKKAIESANRSENSRATLKVHPDEWGRNRAFLSEKGSYNIKVGDEYYEVGFICA